MAYKKGDSLINFSFLFQAATYVVFYTVWHIGFMVCRILGSARYEGKKKLRALKGNAVLVSNHTTLLDPVFISGAAMPRTIWHTLLEATVKAPFLGTFTRLLGGLPLPPGMAGLEKIIKISSRAFRYKPFIHFYPEGDCYLYNQQIQPFKAGAFYVAARLDLPVYPLVTVFSEGRLKPKTPFARRYPRQTLVVLDPLYPGDFVRRKENGELDINSVQAFAETARRRMQDEIDRRRRENPRWGTQAYYRGKMSRLKGINE
ncbi:MAG: 1-acyl-sn-glycerol-3-phosphate acyltransferase [Spirochaetaceae bacterium]|jgi:1-acyl-sn-glycerol-3-phosphate acyltransferase|nr:1-acyl-sn-glycerol-3-phosphate acyltransferase [Spirochaetaceae bacterium]